jgi:hypothetical protein
MVKLPWSLAEVILYLQGSIETVVRFVSWELTEYALGIALECPR